MLRNIGVEALAQLAISMWPLAAGCGAWLVAPRRSRRSWTALPLLGLAGSLFLVRGKARIGVSGYFQTRALISARLSLLADDGLAALNVVENASADTPFVLVLRNFALEAFGMAGEPSPAFTRGGRIMSRLLGKRYAQEVVLVGVDIDRYSQAVEKLLAAELRGHAAVVTIANLHDVAIPQPAENLYRLIITRDDWETHLRLVAPRAAVIVITADYATPGLSRELEMARRLHLEDKTIVLVPKNASAPQSRLGPVGSALTGEASPRYLPMRPDAEILAGFRVLVTEGDPAASGLPRGLDVHSLIDTRRAETATVELSARAAALYRRAQREIAEHLYAEAADSLMELLPMWHELQDIYRVAETLISLGLLTANNDRARGLEFYREALGVIPELTPDERRSLLTAYRTGFVSVLNNIGSDQDRARLRALLSPPSAK